MRPYLQSKIDAALEPVRQLLDLTAEVAGVSLDSTAAASVPNLPVQIEAVRQLLITLSGVDNYPDVYEQRASMRNDALRLRTIALDQRLTATELELASQRLINDAQEALLRALAQKDTTQDARLEELATRLDLLKSTAENLAADLAANQAHDTAQDARLAAEEALSAAQALDIASEKAQNATDSARLAALEAAQQASQAQAAANSAQDELDRARQTADEQAIATAQATATAATQAAAAAQGSANTAQARAALAEADAQAAKTAAATAQTRAETAATAAAAAQATATQAQQAAAANAATLAALQTTVAGKLDAALVRRGSITVPAVTIVVGTPATAQVTFATRFADNNYEVFLSKPGAGLLGVELGWATKTEAGFTLTERNTGLASLAVPASTVDYFAIHN